MDQKGGQMDWEMDILDKTDMDSIFVIRDHIIDTQKMYILKLEKSMV